MFNRDLGIVKWGRLCDRVSIVKWCRLCDRVSRPEGGGVDFNNVI